MPPHGRLDGFLAEAERRALLDWAIAAESGFKPAEVFYGDGGSQARLDPMHRHALKHVGIGPVEPVMRERLLGALPQIMAAAGYTGPEPRSIEIELNGYGDGAHFAPHLDIPLKRRGGEHEDRLISAVYYFHSEPKAFSGGALRLYRFGVDPETAGLEDSIAFEPVQNSLVVFPSWAMHGVEPVHCPSNRFADFRFGLNCWFCRKVAGSLEWPLEDASRR